MTNAWAHPAAEPLDLLLAQCDVRYARRSGPGGQHRNKVETGVILTHRPTGISAEASERHSHARNQSKALFRLRVRLALQVHVPVPPDYQPSQLWRSRCRDGRIAIDPEHDDFPSLLAEALDVLTSQEFDIQAAANVLQVTTSQLVKFLKHEPAALELVNRDRMERGLGRLL